MKRSVKPLQKKAIVIGGGTGAPIVNEALLIAGVDYIFNIVSQTDDGGLTGKMIIDAHGTKFAFSDSLRCMLSHFPPKSRNLPHVKEVIDFLNLRSPREQLGYVAVSILSDRIANPYPEMKRRLENMTRIKLKGEVLPTSISPTTLCFKIKEDDRVFKGEHQLDTRRGFAETVSDFWLDPPVPTSKEVLEILSRKNLKRFLAFGSLHGSTGVNFKHSGFPKAFVNGGKENIYITNITSSANEIHENIMPWDIYKFFQDWTKSSHPIDVFVVPEISRSQFESNPKNKSAVEAYARERSRFIGWEPEVLKKFEKRCNVKVVTHNATHVLQTDGNSVIRHDPILLAKTLKQFLQ